MAKKELNQTQQLFKDLKAKDYQVTMILGMLPDGNVEITPSHPNFAIMSWVLERAQHNLNLVQDHSIHSNKQEVKQGVEA